MSSATLKSPSIGRKKNLGLVTRLAQFSLFLMFSLLPAALLANGSNPPLGLTGAPGEGTCASCHSSATAGSGVTVAFPSTLTYTPGGAAQSLTVAVTGGNAGFELSSRVSSSNGQAGTLAAGSGSNIGTSGSIQYARQSSRAASWNISWTPPATNVGNVIVYAAGVDSSGKTFTNNYTLTPAVVVATQTIAATPATLTFSYDGTTLPATQPVSVTSSGTPIAATTSVSTTTGGSWLTATPPGANTPFPVTVGVNPAGLAVGTYMGAVAIASAGATNSPQSVSITFNVTGVAPPPPPTLSLNPTSLTFSSPSGLAVASQNVAVISSGAAIPYGTSVSTASGGNWLAVNPTSGTSGATGSTGSTVAVSVDSTILATLATGTYTGSVAFTPTDTTISPQNLNVTLKVGTATTAPALHFRLTAVDKDSGGTNQMLLDGQGAIDAAGQLTGGGNFTIYTPSQGNGRHAASGGRIHVLSTGKWKALTVNGFTPAPQGGDDNSGGTLEIGVEFTPMGGTAQPGTMTITDTGADSGVTLAITNGSSFAPTGTSHVSITMSTSGGGGGRSDNEND